jgi:hypothetical protein
MAPHDYLLVSSHGEDAPNNSLDEYKYCHRCGTLRHDYRHNGGQASPNYPLFCTPGIQGWTCIEPECADLPFASEPAETAYQAGKKVGVNITRDQFRVMLQAFVAANESSKKQYEEFARKRAAERGVS